MSSSYHPPASGATTALTWSKYEQTEPYALVHMAVAGFLRLKITEWPDFPQSASLAEICVTASGSTATVLGFFSGKDHRDLRLALEEKAREMVAGASGALGGGL